MGLEEIVKGYDTGGKYVIVEPEKVDDIAPGRSEQHLAASANGHVRQTSDHRGQCFSIPKDRPHVRVTTDPSEVFKRQVTRICKHERMSSDRRTTQQTLVDHPGIRVSTSTRARRQRTSLRAGA
ncbi:hypothetical protein ACGF8B_25475 [Streptomyces sp. NPDC047917]|uniref:hypothetical protein n=1 Tax=Streptomyces sp. NPDC047917 TaxID=3365491 RepID=UPI0037130D82